MEERDIIAIVSEEDMARLRASDRPRHAEIARRAYELYEKRGRAPGRHLEDWLQAERELQPS